MQGFCCTPVSLPILEPAPWGSSGNICHPGWGSCSCSGPLLTPPGPWRTHCPWPHMVLLPWTPSPHWSTPGQGVAWPCHVLGTQDTPSIPHTQLLRSPGSWPVQPGQWEQGWQRMLQRPLSPAPSKAKDSCEFSTQHQPRTLHRMAQNPPNSP